MRLPNMYSQIQQINAVSSLPNHLNSPFDIFNHPDPNVSEPSDKGRTHNYQPVAVTDTHLLSISNLL